MVQVHLYKILLLLCCLQTLLNLNKGLFRAEMGLIVKRLDSFLNLFFLRFLHDLVAEEFAIGHVLVMPILSFHVLDSVHVVHS